jgi:hypothetical protein
MSVCEINGITPEAATAIGQEIRGASHSWELLFEQLLTGKELHIVMRLEDKQPARAPDARA